MCAPMGESEQSSTEMSLGKRIQQLRRDHKLTQRAVAKDLGIDFTYLSKLGKAADGLLAGRLSTVILLGPRSQQRFKVRRARTRNVSARTAIRAVCHVGLCLL